MRKGFTLLELLITSAIGVVLVGIAIIYLNPQELMAQARDQRRIADLAQVNLAVQTYVNSGATIAMGGPNYANACSDQSAPRVFVTVPAGNGETPPNPPPTWTVTQVPSSVTSQITGTGWVPVNFASTTGGAPIATLPFDPINLFAKNLYYAYTCRSDGSFELTAQFESHKYSENGTDPKTRTDGGNDPYMYEAGTILTLNPLSPIAYWSFDENTGTTTYDLSGNNDNGTLSPATNTPAWATPGKLGSAALSFNGGGGYVNAGNGATFNGASSSLSVSFWVKPTSAATLELVIKNNNANGGPGMFEIFQSGSTVTFRTVKSGVSADLASAGAIPAGAWTFVAVTWDGVTKRIYLNGAQDANTQAQAAPLDTTTGNLTVGAYGNGSYSFNGILDEPKIYNRALSASEIQALYTAER